MVQMKTNSRLPCDEPPPLLQLQERRRYNDLRNLKNTDNPTLGSLACKGINKIYT